MNFYNLRKKDFIIQDYIIGTEYTVFVNKNKKKTVVIPIKVYQKKGITTHAKVEKNFMIEKHIKKLINYFNVKNCFNVQLIYKNKKIYILEINPRLSTTFALIVKSGYDPFDKKLSLKFFLKKKLKMYRYLTTRYY